MQQISAATIGLESTRIMIRHDGWTICRYPEEYHEFSFLDDDIYGICDNIYWRLYDEGFDE